MATTYKKLAQLALEMYYNGKSSDDKNHSLRYFAELCAIYIAEASTFDSFTNSNQGESAYANNQFISVFKNQPILSVGGEKYTVLPQTPTALPNGQEIVSVRITGNTCSDCIPMKNQSSFAQDLIGIPKGMVLYKVEDGKIVYVSDNNLLEGTATIKMIGSVSGDDLLTSNVNIPKNYEAYVLDKIMAKLLPLKQIPQDNLNNGVSNPA